MTFKAPALLFASLILTSTAYADTAKIFARNSENDESVEIALSPRGTPRVNGIEKSFPTIKDFREEAEFADPCYTGPVTEAKDLLDQLVEAANGDGDSWAVLKSIRTSRDGVITVVVEITDESGENEEEFFFPRCR
jgi:hypothetical protein